MKKIITLITALAIMITAFAFNASAASTSIAFSSKNPKVGESVSITVTVGTGAAMYSTEFDVSYNPSVLRFDSGDSAAGGAGVVKVAGGVAGGTKQSYTLNFTAIAAGSSSVSASGTAFLADTDEGISASATLSVSDVTKSDNANLSSLKTSAGSLSPRFSQDVTEYTVNVKNNITECKVYGTTVDPDATIAIVGSATLQVGENKRVLTVTAPSGAQKSYTLIIIRSEDEESEETESNTSGTTEEPSPFETVIDGISYMVLKDISSVELPVGFNVTNRLYNNEEITVAVDEKENFELFYLKAADSDLVVPYTYDDAKNTFKRVQIITQGSNSYIVAEIPENLSVTERFVAKTVKIQDLSIGGYISTETKLKDMYYVYCYFGGEYSMYRYDSLENVLQRCPEFEFISDEKVAAGTSDIEFINRFNSLSSNAKTIVVCLLIAFLGVIALSILVVIKLVRRGKVEDFDLDDEEIEDFDSIKFDDDFEIVSDNSEEADEEEENEK